MLISELLLFSTSTAAPPERFRREFPARVPVIVFVELIVPEEPDEKSTSASLLVKLRAARELAELN